MEFLQIAEGLKHQKIDAAFDQRRHLLPECSASFLERSLPERLDAHSQWADRTSNPHIEALDGFARQSCSSEIDVAHLAGHAVPRQPEGISTESVSFNNL